MATQAQVDELLEKMSLERSRLLEVAVGLTPAQARFAPPDAEGEAGWTPLEQLAHLWEMELAYDAFVEACLAAENPNLGALLLPKPPIILEDAHAHTVGDLIDGLNSERATTLALIARLPLTAYDRVGTHPAFGTLTVLQWLRSFYRHDRQHGAQIEGLESDYKPRFLGPEVDQRKLRRQLGAERLRRPSTMDEHLAALREQSPP
jgi:hypothetical protein